MGLFALGCVVKDQKIVALSGAGGFIGTSLREELLARGYEVWPLVRATGGGEGEIFYDYRRKIIDKERLARCYAVIHLAGKNIMSGFWSAKFKKELWESRVDSTRFIASSMAEITSGPKVLISASAVGFYGDTSKNIVDEKTPSGEGFLAELCEAWEKATEPAAEAGIRVVNTRFGVVLGSEGGMLKGLLKLFNIGLGAAIGSGEQYMAVVALEDVVGAIIFALENPTVSGPINVVCPQAINNEKFTDLLAQVFEKKAWLRVPTWVLRSLGEQGGMMLASNKVKPKVLLDEGYDFKFPRVKGILKHAYDLSK